MWNRTDPIRIVIVDERKSVRDGIRKLLTTQSGISILGEASDVSSGACLANRLKPDVVLLGPCLAWQHESVVLGKTDTEFAVIPTIIMLASTDRPTVLQAFQLGARGIISQASAPRALLDCIRAVTDGQYWLDNDTVTIVVNALRELLPNGNKKSKVPKDYGLTPREVDVVAKVADGHSNKEIGRAFSITERTVKHHLTNIFFKLGVSSRLELAVFVVDHDAMKSQPSLMVRRTVQNG